jgi:geranylgeranyl reductase family protein
MAEKKHYDYDLAVVGGGPAGSSGAYHAATLGLKTMLFEKKTYPREKLCGGALSSRCLPLLGDHAKNAINCEVEALHLFAPSFKYFVCDNRDSPGYFVIRDEFDQAMARDAVEAGAQLIDNCPVKTIRPLDSGGYEIMAGSGGNSRAATASHIILATGLQDNTLARQLGIPLIQDESKDYLAMCVMSETLIDNKIPENRQFSGKILGIFLGPVPNGYGWCFMKNGYINIGIGSTGLLLKKVGPKNAYRMFVEKLRKKGILPQDLELVRERLFPLPFKKTAVRTIFGNVLLVGDSAGFVSPVTGEGIYYAVKAGQLAAEAAYRHLRYGTALSSYQENWQKVFGNDLNKYGYLFRETLYKTPGRMEFAVTLGRHDRKMARIMNRMIFGLASYRETIRDVLLRLPVSLLKVVF